MRIIYRIVCSFFREICLFNTDFISFTEQAARRDVRPSLAKKLHVLAALEVRMFKCVMLVI